MEIKTKYTPINKVEVADHADWQRSYAKRISYPEYLYLKYTWKTKRVKEEVKVKVKPPLQLYYEKDLKIKPRVLDKIRKSYSLEEWKQDMRDYLNGKTELENKFRELNKVYG